MARKSHATILVMLEINALNATSSIIDDLKITQLAYGFDLLCYLAVVVLQLKKNRTKLCLIELLPTALKNFLKVEQNVPIGCSIEGGMNQSNAVNW